MVKWATCCSKLLYVHSSLGQFAAGELLTTSQRQGLTQGKFCQVDYDVIVSAVLSVVSYLLEGSAGVQAGFFSYSSFPLQGVGQVPKSSCLPDL